MPVLTHLLFTVKGSDLTVAAAKELDQVRAVCPCKPDSGDCAVTVPAAQLMNLLNNIPQDTEVTFELKDKALHVRAATSSQKLSTFAPSDFPLISADDLPLQVTIPAKTLRRMLGETAFAMGQQDVRAYLNSTLFEVSGNTLTLVATDSYRLAVVSETIEAAPAANTPVKGIVPRSAVLQLLKMLPDTDETLVIGLGEQKAAFSWGNTECVTSRIEGRYPDYRRVIPSENANPKAVTFSREALIRAVSRASLFADEKRPGMQVTLEQNAMTLSCRGDNFETSTVTLPCEWPYEKLQTGFNKRFLSDALSSIKTENATLRFGSEKASLLITKDEEGSSFRAVVMPMTL